MTDVERDEKINRFIERAMSGETSAAVEYAIELLDSGFSKISIIDQVLAPAQREIGVRWQRGELSVADEHLASNVAESTLYALSSELPIPPSRGSVVVACAPGDWHSIAGHMIAEELHASVITATFLGASTPAQDVSRYLSTHRPDALAVSCAMPLFFTGVRELADVAHSYDVPVIAGGRGFHQHPEWAWRVGADAYAPDVASAIDILEAWRATPPTALREPLPFPERLADLEARSRELAARAFDDLSSRVATFARSTTREGQRARENLEYMVRFATAALYVGDATVLTDFLNWIVDLMGAREVSKAAVVAGLESLHSLPEMRGGDVGDVLDAGVAFLTSATHP